MRSACRGTRVVRIRFVRLHALGGCSCGPYHGSMAFEEELAGRIRDLLAGEAEVSERRMFGGLAFLVGGHLAIAASNEGGVLVRVDPSTSDRLTATTPATTAVMRGRPMTGWLRVATDVLGTDAELARWVDRGVGYARSLPPKTA